VQIQDRFWVTSYGIVAMKPPIFVRMLSKEERKALEDGLRSSNAFVVLRRVARYSWRAPEARSHRA